MTQVASSPVAVPRAATTAGQSFVEWGAVLAGAVLAAAISFVLLTFGASIGLSATSPWPNAGMSAKWIASLAIFWAMAQQIGAFMAGGYVAGRVRSRWGETTEHEIEFRDGLHGGLVWAVGVAIGAALFLSAAGAVARTGTEAVSLSATSARDPMALVLDTMLRPATAAPASAAAPARTQAAIASGRGDDARAEMARIVAGAVASGSLADPDRTYLAQLVAQRTGLPQADADKRVGDAITAAKAAADKARRSALLTGFVTAASLIISFGAAWWAALKGGQHRDNSIPARFDFARRTRPALAG